MVQVNFPVDNRCQSRGTACPKVASSKASSAIMSHSTSGRLVTNSLYCREFRGWLRVDALYLAPLAPPAPCFTSRDGPVVRPENNVSEMKERNVRGTRGAPCIPDADGDLDLGSCPMLVVFCEG